MADGSPTSAPQANRPKMRFGLRTLLIVMTAACVMFALLGSEISDARRAKATYAQFSIPHIQFAPRQGSDYSLANLPGLRAIAAWMGGPFLTQRVTSMHVATAVDDDDLAVIAANLPCELLHLYQPQLTDAGMDEFARMPRLKELWIPGVTVSPQGLAKLSNAAELRTLVIKGPQVDDRYVSMIDQLRSVRTLQLVQTSLTPDGLKHVARMPGLRHLFISGSRLTPEHIDAICDMAKLEELETFSPGWTDADLEQLVNLQALRQLTISASSITCDGLASLAELPGLEELVLNNMVQLDDACIDQLARIKTLKKVTFKGARVTGQGQRRLEAALPDCTVRIIGPQP